MFLSAAVVLVVTSSPILKDLLQEIGGDDIQVENVVEDFKDPHHFDPSFKTIKNMEHARLAVFVGPNFESWAQNLIFKTKFQASVLQMSEKVTTLEKDSHFWLNPDLMVQASLIIEKELKILLPERSKAIEKRSGLFQEQLRILSAQIKNRFQKLPKDQRQLITETNSLTHFCIFAALECRPLSHRRHRTEVSARELSQAKKTLQSQPAQVYAFESHQSKTISKQRARDLGLNAVGPIYIENFGDSKTGPKTYLQLMTVNAETLFNALEKTAVPK